MLKFTLSSVVFLFLVILTLSTAQRASAAVFRGSLFPNGIFGSEGLFPNGIFGDGGVFATSSASSKTFTARLTGSMEVPPTTSTASANVRVRIASGSSMAQLKVKNITDMTMAHLHCGMVGQNGPIVVALFQASSPITANQIVVTKSLTDASVVANACSPAITNLAELKTAIKAGRIYVNVHTSLHPAGEIRGQVQ